MSKKNTPLTSTHSIKNRPLAGLLNTILYAGIIVAGNANAANNSPDNNDPARWFQVELILFAHNSPQALDAEQWPEIVGVELPLENLQELHLPPAIEEDAAEESGKATVTDSPAPDTGTEPETEAVPLTKNTHTHPSGPIAFQILDKSKWQLGKIARRLQRSSRVKVLLHVAWQQPTYALAQAQPVLLFNGMTKALPPVEKPGALTEVTKQNDDAINPSAVAPSPEALEPVFASEADTLIGPDNPRLIGTVKLSVARYLHLAVDLLYRLPVTQKDAVPVADFDLWYDRPYPTLYEPQGPAFRLEEWQAIRGFRMLESRRMRSKVLHYLDHPMFGMVVLITPVELPVTEDAETETSSKQ